MCSVVVASSADPSAINYSSPSGIVANTAPAFASNGSPSVGAGAAVWHVGWGAVNRTVGARWPSLPELCPKKREQIIRATIDRR